MTAAPQADRPRYPIGAVDRALRLMLMFRDRPTVRIVDAAKELDAAPSTVHRLLAMLVAYGFVTRDAETQTYKPGEVLVDLGVQVVNQWDFVELARPLIADLVASFGETATLGVLRHNSVLFVVEVESDQLIRIGNQLGRRIPAFHSSLGRVLLADLPPERVQQLYPEPRITDAAEDIVVDRDELLAELERIRERGYATNQLPQSMQFTSVAVPIRRLGRAVAAIATAAPSQRVSDDWTHRALRALRLCAAELEELLAKSAGR